MTLDKKTYQIATALNNFQDWLDGLEMQGVSKQTTDAIWFEAKSYLDKGIEPKIAINQNEIVINGKAIQFGASGLGFIDPATLTAVGSIFSSGAFSDIFGGIGKTSDNAGITRVVNPLKKRIATLLSTSNASNRHLKLTEADKHINATISHENKVNSRFSKVALPELNKMLAELRGSANQSGFTSVLKTTNEKFEDFWDGKGSNLAHSGTYNYREYNPSYKVDSSVNITNTPINTTNTSITDNLIKLANGLYQNTQTGQVGTANQVATTQQNNPPRTQNAQGSNSDNKSNTGLIIGVSLAGLLVAGVVAKKMNII